MTQSVKYKKRMNFIYGMGAAMVIIGALFKIQHISFGFLTGGFMLTIGLITEALVFGVSAFDYSEIEDKQEEQTKTPEVMLSLKLDTLLEKAKVDVKLIESLGTGIRNFQETARGLSVASESISSTSKYNAQMSLAAAQMETLNSLYEVQAENAGRQSELNEVVVENIEKLKEEMESLAENLSSLNGVYEGMLSAMSK